MALNPETLCGSRKNPPQGSRGLAGPCRGADSPPRGERGSPCHPPQPSPQWGKSKRRSCTHRSSWEGWMYPEERIFRDRMLGSMRDSSASGVLRIRPASAAWGRRSGDRWWPYEGPGKGQGQPACLHPPAAPPPQAAAARCSATQHWRSWSSSWTQWLEPRHPAHVASWCHLPGSRCFAIAGQEGRQGIKPRVGMWARKSLRGCSGARQAGGCSQPTQPVSAYPQPAPALPSSG